MEVRFLREILPKRGLVRKGSRPWLEVDIVRTIASIMQLGCTKFFALVPLVMPVVRVIKTERDRCYGMEEVSSYEVSENQTIHKINTVATVEWV